MGHAIARTTASAPSMKSQGSRMAGVEELQGPGERACTERHGDVVGERPHDASDDDAADSASSGGPSESDELESSGETDHHQPETSLRRLDAAHAPHAFDERSGPDGHCCNTDGHEQELHPHTSRAPLGLGLGQLGGLAQRGWAPFEQPDGSHERHVGPRERDGLPAGNPAVPSKCGSQRTRRQPGEGVAADLAVERQGRQHGPAPSATRQMATLAPMTSPRAIAGAWRREAVTAVASSSGSAPASRTASAKALTPRRADATAKCSANVSAPQTMAATPRSATATQRITSSPGGWPSDPFALVRVVAPGD